VLLLLVLTERCAVDGGDLRASIWRRCLSFQVTAPSVVVRASVLIMQIEGPTACDAQKP